MSDEEGYPMSDLEESEDEGAEQLSQGAAADGEEAAGEEEVQEEEEPAQKEPELDPNPLSEEAIRASLSMLSRVGTGLAHAYVTLNVTAQGLTDVQKASALIHLRHVNLSQNYLKDVSPLSSLTHLLTLRVDENLLSRVNVEELPYLQVASFVNNRVTSLDGLTHPLLNKLFLAHNQIQRVAFPDPERLASLTILDLRGNKMEALAGVFPPNLKELYLAANLISRVGAVEGLSQLRVLHLRDNQLEGLDGLAELGLPALSYLNLRGNHVEEPSEVQKLAPMTQIRALILQDNPIAEMDDYRVEVLAALQANKDLLRLDKDDVDAEELTEAEELMEEQEAKRKEEEEEQRREEEASQAVGDREDTGLTGGSSVPGDVTFKVEVDSSALHQS